MPKQANVGREYVKAQLVQEIETRERMIDESRRRPKDFPVEARLSDDEAREAIKYLNEMKAKLEEG